MYAYRVNIFHITYGDAVAACVTHYLVLNLFPACDTAFHQYLSHAGKTETVGQNFHQFCLIVGDPAAAASKGKCRTEYHRITDSIGEFDTVLHIVHHLGRRTGLTDFFHGILKRLTVLCLENSLRRSTD